MTHLPPDPSGGWPPPVPLGPRWPGPVTDPGAAWALTLAIFAFIVPIVPAIGALVLAGSAQRRIAADPSWREGADLARSAQALAVVHLVLAAAVVVALFVASALGSVG